MRAALSRCAMFALLIAAPAAAQNDNVTVVPYGGYNADVEEIFIAGGVGIPLESVRIKGQPLVVQPSFEVFPFIDGGSLFSIVGTLIIPIELANRPPVVPYGIGDISWSRQTFTVGTDSNNEIFFGFGGGVAFAQSITRTHPFVELEARVGDGSTVYLKGGVRLGVG